MAINEQDNLVVIARVTDKLKLYFDQNYFYWVEKGFPLVWEYMGWTQDEYTAYNNKHEIPAREFSNAPLDPNTRDYYGSDVYGMKESILETPLQPMGGIRQFIKPDTRFKIPRYFTTPDKHPCDAIEWEWRQALIEKANGEIAFQQDHVEFPSFWSQTATNIVASKYFRTINGNKESSVRQMIERVATTIADWGVCDGYFDHGQEVDTFNAELIHILLNQYASPNSPVWFNIGCPDRIQAASACYILHVEDSMPGILEWYRQEGLIFSRGAGSGVNVSTLRAKGEPISKGGVSSGPLSFMRAADASAFAIKSAGVTRRSARMVVMDMDHPDIEEFIFAKMLEERKARILALAGYDDSLDGEIYATVAHQNCNMSVSASDRFFFSIEGQFPYWETKYRTTGDAARTYEAKDLFRKIAEAAYECGDPGIHFKTRMNEWHTCPNSGPIRSSNPCLRKGTRLLTNYGWQDVEALSYWNGYTIFDGENYSPGRVVYTGKKPIVRLYVQDITGYELTLDCTPDHHILIGQYEHGPVWVDAVNTKGMILHNCFSSERYYKVTKVEDLEITDDVYDFSVDSQRHMGLANGLLVSNCSEYIFLDDTACNLSSINLLKFLQDDNSFDIKAFKHVVNVMITAQEILVSRSEYPTEAISKNSEDYRTLGLGYANLGALLMAKGLPYDSDEGRSYAASITALMTGQAYKRSAELAAIKGPFNGFDANRGPMIAVIQKHREALQDQGGIGADTLWHEAFTVWNDAQNFGETYGYRNAQVTLLAPTGTISFMMDCFTGDTLVATADGRNAVTLKQLAREGKDVPVYASENGRTVIKQMRGILKIRGNAKIVRVNLDDGSYVRCTTDHKFMLSNGTYKCAEDLQDGESLMRFDSIINEETGKPRRCVWMGPRAGGNHFRGQSWKLQYRLLGAKKFPSYDGRSGGIIHHDDEDTLNDEVDNLILCEDFSEHLRMHWAEKTPEERREILRARNLSLTPEQVKEKSRKIHEAQTPEERRARARKAVEAHTSKERAAWTTEGWDKIDPEARSERLKKGWAGVSAEERTARAKRIWEKRRANGTTHTRNHKVISVVQDGREDVYCGEVEDVHNFAIITRGKDPKYDDLSGVIVHNCTTTGVEPDVALVNYKKLVGGGTIKHINDIVPRALKTLGYKPAEPSAFGLSIKHICQAIEEGDITGLAPIHLPVFDCAFPSKPGGRAISWEGHVKMVAALQPFLSGSISKSINMPESSTIEDIEKAFMMAWKLGCKSIAIYRDGSKHTQVLTTQDTEKSKEHTAVTPETDFVDTPSTTVTHLYPQRRRLPDTREAITHKASIGGAELYITAGMYADKSLGEIFINMAKEGSTLSGFAESFAVVTSLALQYGVPLSVLGEKFKHVKFEPAGFTGNKDIPMASSVMDYIFRWLEQQFLRDDSNAPIHVPEPTIVQDELDTQNLPQKNLPLSGFSHLQNIAIDAPLCSECGSICRRSGSCYTCVVCGSASGCGG